MKKLSEKEINILISTVKVDRANLEHIAKTGRLNGSLLVELRKFARLVEKVIMEEVTMAKTIYDLKLHETLSIVPIGIDSTATDYFGVTRVPGGWIYSVWDTTKQEYVRDIFVPFNNEFQIV